MVIDLRKCADKPLEAETCLNLSAGFAGDRELAATAPLRASLRVASAGPGRFTLTGEFAVTLDAVCDRCLEAFPLAVAGRLALRLLPGTERRAPAPGETEMRSEDVDVVYYDEHRLEVAPLLEEQVNLALPMRSLCQESCRGLCPRCGANRNRADCGCREVTPAPRLENLKDLLHL